MSLLGPRGDRDGKVGRMATIQVSLGNFRKFGKFPKLNCGLVSTFLFVMGVTQTDRQTPVLCLPVGQVLGRMSAEGGRRRLGSSQPGVRRSCFYRTQNRSRAFSRALYLTVR